LSIDISSATAAVVTPVSPGLYVDGLDPNGEFSVLSDSAEGAPSVIAIGTGTPPPYV